MEVSEEFLFLTSSCLVDFLAPLSFSTGLRLYDSHNDKVSPAANRSLHTVPRLPGETHAYSFPQLIAAWPFLTLSLLGPSAVSNFLNQRAEEQKAGLGIVWVLTEYRWWEVLGVVWEGKDTTTLQGQRLRKYKLVWEISDKFEVTKLSIIRWLEVGTWACGRFQNWDIPWWSFAWKWKIDRVIGSLWGDRMWAENAVESEVKTNYIVE